MKKGNVMGQTKLAKKIEALETTLDSITSSLTAVGKLWFDVAKKMVDLFNDVEYRAKLDDASEDMIGDTLNAKLPDFTPCDFWEFRDLLSYYPDADAWATTSVTGLYRQMCEEKVAPDPDAPKSARKSVKVSEYEVVVAERDAFAKKTKRMEEEGEQSKRDIDYYRRRVQELETRVQELELLLAQHQVEAAT